MAKRRITWDIGQRKIARDDTGGFHLHIKDLNRREVDRLLRLLNDMLRERGVPPMARGPYTITADPTLHSIIEGFIDRARFERPKPIKPLRRPRPRKLTSLQPTET